MNYDLNHIRILGEKEYFTSKGYNVEVTIGIGIGHTRFTFKRNAWNKFKETTPRPIKFEVFKEFLKKERV